MSNSGKKIPALPDKKNKYSNSRVVRKKISERNKKPSPPPPFKLNGWTLTNSNFSSENLSVHATESDDLTNFIA